MEQPVFIARPSGRDIRGCSDREAARRLVKGRISFSEFVDICGEGFQELLEFMTEHDLHPGRPAEVLFCIEHSARPGKEEALRRQLRELYEKAV